MDYSYRLSTPEQVDLAYDVAGLGTRSIAMIFDSLVQGLVMLAVLITMSLVGSIAQASVAGIVAGSNGNVLILVAIALGVLLVFLINSGYFIFFEMVWNGQSPGKRAVGIRVLTTEGQPITLGQSLIRNLLRLVDMLPSSYMLGAMVMLFNSRSQRLGDLAAGTIVVKIRREGSPRILSTLSADSELPPQQAAAFGAEDVALAREFLLRRDDLPTERRAALAERIAARLRARLGPHIPDEAAESLIARVAAVRR